MSPMQVHFGTELLHAEWPRSVVCVGTFDGVHLGHQAVISEAIRQAKAEQAPCILVTFDRHPAAVVAPERCPPAIASITDNLAWFSKLGVALSLVLPFTYELSQKSASYFLDEVLIGHARADRLVVGHDFAMGHNREGNTEWLQNRFPTTVVPPYEVGGKRVSSSEIRQAVTIGDVRHAGELLGHPFAIPGIVVEGEKLGRQLGYPTANIVRSFHQVTPADGIFAGWVECSRGRFQTALSIGKRPAVKGENRTIEAYLMDYPGDSLYGESVHVELVHRLRDELDFPDLDALKNQIGQDVAHAREVLSA